MEADMKTSNLINNLVLVDAILTMGLGLDLFLLRQRWSSAVWSHCWAHFCRCSFGDGPGPDVQGCRCRRKQRSEPDRGRKADAQGRMIYLVVSIAAILTLALGLIAHKTELALIAGGLVPIGGLVFALAAGAGSVFGGKTEAESLQNFTSFGPVEEQTFVVFERTSLETEKRGLADRRAQRRSGWPSVRADRPCLRRQG